MKYFEIINPHITEPEIRTWDSLEDYHQFLKDNSPDGFSYETYSRAEWDNYADGEDEEWKAIWHQPGVELFDNGAEEITVIWYGETNRELYPSNEAPSEIEELAVLYGLDLLQYKLIDAETAQQIADFTPDHVGHYPQGWSRHRFHEIQRQLAKLLEA